MQCFVVLRELTLVHTERRIMITVKVIHQSSGSRVKGKKVALGIDTTLSGGISHAEWTDSEGEAHFDVKAAPGKVFVDGSAKYEGHLSGRIVVYI